MKKSKLVSESGRAEPAEPCESRRCAKCHGAMPDSRKKQTLCVACLRDRWKNYESRSWLSTKYGYAGKICNQCQERQVQRPRGMCYRCYVSWMKTRTVITGLRPHGEPVNARPGTEKKILALQDRASRGLHLFHPDDATLGAP